MIDHSLLRPDLTYDDILRGCQEARENNFITVCVNPAHVELAANALKGTNVRVCSVVSFPLGLSTTDTKVHEAKMALANGAREVDMVMNYGALRSGQTLLVQEDVRRVVEAAKAFRKEAIVKVILENCYLTKQEKITGCTISVEADADFVKTSTGFGAGGATIDDVRLMRQAVGPKVGIKAAGGVRTIEQAIEMIEAGATRIGTSSSLSIIQSVD
jgi:deoxyribose-phosphate aldolase